MNALEIGLLYLSGFISGLIAMAGVVFHIGNKALNSGKKRAKELAKQIQSEDVVQAALEPRMARIKDIAKMQMDMQAAHDGPQRNAMDGKYKNSLMRQMKELEEEKVTILNSIVKDGFDPDVNVVKEDGTSHVVKLSEFLAGYDSKGYVPKSDDSKVKQVGKFTVLKGGKDDKPTIH